MHAGADHQRVPGPRRHPRRAAHRCSRSSATVELRDLAVHHPDPAGRTAAPAPRRPARSVVCENRVTSADHCRNSSAWCTARGLVASTPMAWSRTSHPWQYGQCRTSRPHRCARPGHVGELVHQAGGDQQAPGVHRPAVGERSPRSRSAVRLHGLRRDHLARRRPRRRTTPPRRARSRSSSSGRRPLAAEVVVHVPGRRVARRSRRPPPGPTGGTGPAPAPRSARPRRHRRSPRRTSSPSSISSARRAGRTTALPERALVRPDEATSLANPATPPPHIVPISGVTRPNGAG